MGCHRKCHSCQEQQRRINLNFLFSILESLMMRYFLTFTFILSFFLQTTFAAGVDNFSDKDKIPAWAHGAIGTLVQKGILSGNSDGSFAPSRQMNRAEFCKVLVNATGVDMYIPLESSFPDVERDDWFFDFVETARHHGWVSGYPDGTFQPGNKINRAEAAKILVNAFELDVPESKDNEPWFGRYFRTLERDDLLAYDTTTDDEDSGHNPSRSEISEQIFRFMKKTGRVTAHDTVYTDDESEDEEETEAEDAPPSFVYQESSGGGSMKIEDDAGSLYIQKGTFTQRAKVKRNQTAVLAHELKLQSKDGVSEIAGFQFRRVGNGIYSDFDDLWLEEGGKMISDRIKPYKDLVTIPLKQTKLIVGSSIKKVQLKVDMSQTAKTGNNSRWVLYLPEWIDSNTAKKIGFFPFGGVDIEVE